MDSKEFESESRRYTPELLTHAFKFTKDEDSAKDLVQDTLLKGLRFCHSFDGGTNLKGWLYVIMKNTFINDYRKESKKHGIIIQSDEIHDGNLVASAEKNTSVTNFALEDIKKALSHIKPKHSIAFQRYFEGYKYEEIAVELDIPIGTVKTYIHQARISLKKYLEMYR